MYSTIPSYEDIQNRFAYHSPIVGQIERYGAIRYEAKQFALQIDNLCPNSREKSLALTKIEEAVMWANAAIARNEREVEEAPAQKTITEAS